MANDNQDLVKQFDAAMLALLEDDELDGDETTAPILQTEAAFRQWQNALANEITQPLVRKFLYNIPDWLRQELAGRVDFTVINKTDFVVRVDGRWKARIRFNPHDTVHAYINLQNMTESREFLQRNLAPGSKFKKGPQRLQSWNREVYDFWLIDEGTFDLLKSFFRDIVPSKRLPDVPRQRILDAMAFFDQNYRNNATWQNWEQKKNHGYAIRENNRNYPVKKIVEMATDVLVNYFISTEATAYVTKRGFSIVELRSEPKLEGPAFVVVVKNSAGLDLKNYYFNNRASGERAKLHEAVSKQLAGGPPVYLIVYSPGPDYGFSGWARVTKISGSYDTEYALELDYHPFRPILELKGGAAYLRNELQWLKNGLKQAFNYKAIRQIEPTEFEKIIQTAGRKPNLKDLAYSALAAAPNNTLSFEDILTAIREEVPGEDISAQELDSQMLADERFNKLGGENSLWMLRQGVYNSGLPAVWYTLAQYLNFVQNLPDGDYTAANLAQDARRYGQEVNSVIDPQIFAKNLCQLRLLHAVGDQTTPESTVYRRHTYVGSEKSEALLRLMALGLLLAKETVEESYFLPAIPILRRWKNNPNEDWQPVASFGLETEIEEDGPRLLEWYAEAGLVEKSDDGAQWRVRSSDPEPSQEQNAAATTYNEFLQALLDERDGTSQSLPPVEQQQNLRPLSDNELKERLAELGRDLLIDEMVVRRIYRSLVAGRHVVLSGPPGTGKTELARRLPTLLWREKLEAHRITLTLDKSPVEKELFERHGYLPVIVTATEDWSVRDVVAGIGPRLSESENSERGLSYDIQLRHLTRAIMKNYQGMSTAADLEKEKPARGEYQEDGKRYAGVWLVIDEFTRAPVDAAFGSLLTTLGGSNNHLAVQKRDGSETNLELPPDFRIIGTLNSFDRHFLNQMSEALKRRFDFIDVLPPQPKDSEYEHGIAVKRALEKLQKHGFSPTLTEGATAVLRLNSVTDGKQQPRTVCEPLNDDFERTFDSFKRIFQTIRVFRQLGTAQVEAVYVNLFAGKLTGMEWRDALDTALADSLADQLQVLTRDEQKIMLAFLENAGNSDNFQKQVNEILKNLPANRQSGMLRTLTNAHRLRAKDNSQSPTSGTPELTPEQLETIFGSGRALELPTVADSIFYNRLQSVVSERGL